jgi:hypothetical protein
LPPHEDGSAEERRISRMTNGSAKERRISRMKNGWMKKLGGGSS